MPEYTKRPQYDIDVDLATKALQEHPASTISELAKLTNRNYSAMQQATVRLSNRNLVTYDSNERPRRYTLSETGQEAS